MVISLRPLVADDLEMVRTWRNSPDVARWMYSDHQITPEEHAAWFEGLRDDPRRVYWIVEQGAEPIGLACLSDIDLRHRRCSWAFYLADPERRAKALGGFVEFAVLEHVFGVLGLDKLCCEVLSENQTVLRLHERFGFHREGVLREHIFKGGQFHDVVCLAITRPQWEARRPEVESTLRRIEARQAGASRGGGLHEEG